MPHLTSDDAPLGIHGARARDASQICAAAIFVRLCRHGDSRTVERTETLASNVRLAPFCVEDQTGRVRVTPDGAVVDAQRVFDTFEESPPRGRIRLGGVVVDLRYGMRTLGHRYREEILQIDAPVYVLGVVASDGGIARPGRGTRDAGFIISYRSEEALSRSHTTDRVFMWVGYGALALGAKRCQRGVRLVEADLDTAVANREGFNRAAAGRRPACDGTYVPLRASNSHWYHRIVSVRLMARHPGDVVALACWTRIEKRSPDAEVA